MRDGFGATFEISAAFYLLRARYAWHMYPEYPTCFLFLMF